MSHLIEDYALIGDTHTAALVSRGGSIDWLCLPRFDSGACFAALLGDESHGLWSIAPAGPIRESTRRYREDTLVLETEFTTETGRVRLVDCMPHRHHFPTVVRVVEGLAGQVDMSMLLRLRFDYGWVVPWVRRTEDGLHAVAGPDAVSVQTPVPLHGENKHTVADFRVQAGERVPFILAWHRSVDPPPDPVDADSAITACETAWRQWSGQCSYRGPWREAVVRSLITLKALTYEPSGAVVAAATTSLPEQLGGSRNWDYRYSWLRDATFTLQALTNNGYLGEAQAWRAWLLRAAAGDPSQLQIMYGIEGERRLTEITLDWLPGYGSSLPVRIGNAAAEQFQLDVYGEVMDAMHEARAMGLTPDDDAWALQQQLVGYVEAHWREPDEGIWEIRGPRRHFTHSKVMAWVALDRAARAGALAGLPGDAEHWRRVADEIHADICTQGFDSELGSFVQSYGSTALDASLLLLPLVGFLPPEDPRIRGTVRAVERDLVTDGLVRRYRTDTTDGDGLAGNEATFLICSFWLVDNLVLIGERERAATLLERLLALRNDVGLLAEEYDPLAGRLLGNFPQAFSHVGLINAVHNFGHPHPDRPKVNRSPG